jgi:hydrogenase/urease accessory protein HupE
MSGCPRAMKWFVLGALLLVVGWRSAMAHATWPVYVQIDERSAGEYRVRWQAPRVMPPHAVPHPVLPDSCQSISGQLPEPQLNAYAFRQSFRCGVLGGMELGIHYPQHNPALTAVYRIRFLDDTVYTHVARPDERTWTIPRQRSRLQTLAEYGRLGVHHITTGIDHLLFVLCLMCVAGTWRRLLAAVTGFTLGHSLTLALATLEIVRPPVAPVEACIALSILLLAAEIVRRRTDTLSYRFPGAISTGFGLLHGFGFASALRDSGLPQTDVPTALVSFNVGVEAGQLLFISCVLLTLRIRARWGRSLRLKQMTLLPEDAVAEGVAVPRAIGLLAAYVCGSAAVFWYLERLMGFWAAP